MLVRLRIGKAYIRSMIILAFTITTQTQQGRHKKKKLFLFLRKAGSGKNQALSYSVLFTREDAFSIFNCFQCTVMSQQQISWHTLRSKTKRCCYKLDRTEKNSPEETESKFLVSEIDIFWRALMELGIY